MNLSKRNLEAKNELIIPNQIDYGIIIPNKVSARGGADQNEHENKS